MHSDMRVNSRDRTGWKALGMVCANLQGVVDAGLHASFEEYVTETERLHADNDQRGFYKHLMARWGWEVVSEKRAVYHRRGWHASKGQGAHS